MRREQEYGVTRAYETPREKEPRETKTEVEGCNTERYETE